MTATNPIRHLRVVEPPDLRGIVDQLVNSGHSQNTKRAYRNAWQKFCLFCAARFEDPERAPAETVGEFLASLYCDGRSVSMMRSTTSGLRFRLSQNDRWTPDHSDLTRKILTGAATNRGLSGYLTQVQAAPLARREFGLVVTAGRKAIKATSSDYARADIWTDLAICSIMRDGLLRRSEACALDWEHIRRDPEDGSAEGTILRSKTDQEGEGAVFYISPTSMQFLDAIGRPQRGAVFVSRKNHRMIDRTICRRIQRAVARAGLEGNFSGHSPRVGMTQDLVQSGFSSVDLQHAGRWKSHGMPGKYVRNLGAKFGAVARWHRSRSSETAKWRRNNARRAAERLAAHNTGEAS